MVLAVKQDAGTATPMDLVELAIIQEIRKLKGELAEQDPNFDNE